MIFVFLLLDPCWMPSGEENQGEEEEGDWKDCLARPAVSNSSMYAF
jgi:hypothetical protein